MRRAPTAGLILLVAALVLLVPAGGASAQGLYVGTNPPDAGALDHGTDGTPQSSSSGSGSGSGSGLGSGSHFTRAASGKLPVTGSDLLQLIAIAALAIGVGTLMVRRGRRLPGSLEPPTAAVTASGGPQ